MTDYGERYWKAYLDLDILFQKDMGESMPAARLREKMDEMTSKMTRKDWTEMDVRIHNYLERFCKE